MFYMTTGTKADAVILGDIKHYKTHLNDVIVSKQRMYARKILSNTRRNTKRFIVLITE